MYTNKKNNSKKILTNSTNAIEYKLGYKFRDITLLESALTPPSAGLSNDNQRLEFLGDSVLHLCISKLIYREHPKWSEGDMSKLRGMLVCNDTLYKWALELPIVLNTGPRSSKKNINLNMRNSLVDALEAILAAIFLDASSNNNALTTVQLIIEQHFIQEIRSAFIGIWKNTDSKTTLQERIAAASLKPPIYKLLERSGPDHSPTFKVQVQVNNYTTTAVAETLKKAQTKAARLMLQIIPK